MTTKQLVKVRNLVFDVMLFLEDPETIDWGNVSTDEVEELYVVLRQECAEQGVNEDEMVD